MRVRKPPRRRTRPADGRTGAGRNHDAIKRQRLLGTIRIADAQGGRIFECRSPLQVVNLSLLGKDAKPAGEFFHHIFFERPEAGEIDLWGTELDAPALCLL